ncbi:glycosyl hydrolase family 8 [Dictyobacter vulcani]|nr:glycosyl hydrolase family 8 [Dictyobacter vulcani]
MERARGMAPPMRITPGWWRPQLFLAHYLCSVSHSNAIYLEQWRTQEWKKPPPLQGVRSVTYMHHSSGDNQGYFAWECTPTGQIIDDHAASDADQWFAMDLFFASGRWGNGYNIYNYQDQAQKILHNMLHHGTINNVTNMFDLNQKQVVLVPYMDSATYTDPSYHFPAYYELWSRWATEDQSFWAQAATTSRQFLQNTVNTTTGLAPDYANFDGTPHPDNGHGDFRFDAWRVNSNIAVDYAWFANDSWEKNQSDRVQNFFNSQGMNTYGNQYTLNGQVLSTDHSTGLIAMNAVASLAATQSMSHNFVDALWNAPVPSGQWRYYDGMLYMLALLHDSGNFHIYTPVIGSKRVAKPPYRPIHLP